MALLLIFSLIRRRVTAITCRHCCCCLYFSLIFRAAADAIFADILLFAAAATCYCHLRHAVDASYAVLLLADITVVISMPCLLICCRAIISMRHGCPRRSRTSASFTTLLLDAITLSPAVACRCAPYITMLIHVTAR